MNCRNRDRFRWVERDQWCFNDARDHGFNRRGNKRLIVTEDRNGTGNPIMIMVLPKFSNVRRRYALRKQEQGREQDGQRFDGEQTGHATLPNHISNPINWPESVLEQGRVDIFFDQFLIVRPCTMMEKITMPY